VRLINPTLGHDALHEILAFELPLGELELDAQLVEVPIERLAPLGARQAALDEPAYWSHHELTEATL
jgi:hypothetical protein